MLGRTRQGVNVFRSRCFSLPVLSRRRWGLFAEKTALRKWRAVERRTGSFLDQKRRGRKQELVALQAPGGLDDPLEIEIAEDVTSASSWTSRHTACGRVVGETSFHSSEPMKDRLRSLRKLAITPQCLGQRRW
jgi:hypothetical protein